MLNRFEPARCPKCGGEKQLLRIDDTKNGVTSDELIFTMLNRCAQCGFSFHTIATYKAQREIVQYIDGALAE